MSYDDEDDAQVAVQAFGGLLQHVNKYKGQVNRLKKGHPSGISSMFGRAVELLPDECLEGLADEEHSYEVGDSIFAEGVDVDTLQEILKGYFEDAGDVPNEEETEEFNSEPEAATVSDQLQEQDSLTTDLSAEELDMLRFFNEPETEEDSVMLEDVRDESVLAKIKPDLHVIDPNGAWLWDVFFLEDCVGHVQMADGTTIIRAQHGRNYVIVKPALPAARLPEVEIVGAVAVDCRTGNVFYENGAGDQAVAFLNNGWRIDQLKRAGAEDECFVTEPLRAGQVLRNRTQVKSVMLDVSGQSVSCETMDGVSVITLRIRQLV